MDLKEYQEQARGTAIYQKRVKTQVGRLNYTALGLNGEAGEVANNVKKITRDGKGVMTKEIRARIDDELGDCLWYVAMAAAEMGIDLDTLAENNLAKLNVRYNAGDGDA